MDDWVLPVIFGLFALFEGLQVFLLLRAVRTIKERVLTILPVDKTAGDIISEAVLAFMRDLNDPAKPENATIVGGFIRGAALAGYEEIAKKVPMLKSASGLDTALEKAANKNPWVGLALGLAQAGIPMLQQKIEETQNSPNNGQRRGGSW